MEMLFITGLVYKNEKSNPISVKAIATDTCRGGYFPGA